MSHWYVYGLFEAGRVEEIRYVGVTSLTPETRLKQHLREAKSGHHGHKCNWIRKIGSDRVGVRVLQTVAEDNTAALHFAEKFWIFQLKLQGMPLTNATDGGLPEFGFKHTPDIIARMAEMSRGRTHTEEAKLKISEALSGVSRESGKPLSEDHKRKISEAQRGVPKPSSKKIAHIRWHTNKGVSKPETCRHCAEA